MSEVVIDLDRNATMPVLADAAAAMAAAPQGNPASAHRLGRKARQALEHSRETIAALLGAHPDEVIITSGATEANNLAVRAGGVCPRMDSPESGGRPLRVIASPLEHPCVLEPLKQLAAHGFALDWLSVSPRGIVQIPNLDPSGSDAPAFATVMLVNHETGAIQPVRDIAVSLPGVPVHCDAAQAVGKIPVHFHHLEVTSLSVSAHKFGGPKGVGVLLLKRGTPWQPLMFGGHQQQGRRPGTEPVPLVVGMAVALYSVIRNLDANRVHLEALRARLWERLQAVAAPLVLNGPEIGSPDVVPSTLNVSFPGCRADLLLMALDLAGVACSTGSACSSGSLLPSPSLRAMSVPDDVLRSAMRFSFGPELTFADIDDAADRIGSVVRRLRGESVGTAIIGETARARGNP